MIASQDSQNRLSFRPSRIGLGTWPLGGPVVLEDESIGRGTIAEAQAIRTVETARKCGVTFFDTADIYGLGRSESILGRALGPTWSSCFVGTKVGKIIRSGQLVTEFSPAHIQESAEQSLRRLRKDTIDLYQLHNPPLSVVSDARVIECLEALRSQGKIRSWGVSARLVSEAVEMIRQGFVGASLQVVFNFVRQEASDTLFALAAERGIAVIARVPLEYGVLTGKFTQWTSFPADDHRLANLQPRLAQELEHAKALSFLTEAVGGSLTIAALRFCLSFPEVTTVIPGARTPEQVRENVLALALGALPPSLTERAREWFRRSHGSQVVQRDLVGKQ